MILAYIEQQSYGEEKDTTSFENRGGESDHSFVIFVHHICLHEERSSKTRVRLAIQSQFQPGFAGRNQLHENFRPGLGPVANAGMPAERAGPASQADSCNCKVENTCKL